VSARNCPACGKPLPERDLGGEDDEGGEELEPERLPDGTPSELRRFCPPCRERLKEAKS
jgi:hypothetical protein